MCSYGHRLTLLFCKSTFINLYYVLFKIISLDAANKVTMKWAEKVPTMNIYNQQALDIVTGDAKPVITSTSSATSCTVTSAETQSTSTAAGPDNNTTVSSSAAQSELSAAASQLQKLQPRPPVTLIITTNKVCIYIPIDHPTIIIYK